jgi:hypothetical protein
MLLGWGSVPIASLIIHSKHLDFLTWFWYHEIGCSDTSSCSAQSQPVSLDHKSRYAAGALWFWPQCNTQFVQCRLPTFTGSAVNTLCFQAKIILDQPKETSNLHRLEAYSFDIMFR